MSNFISGENGVGTYQGVNSGRSSSGGAVCGYGSSGSLTNGVRTGGNCGTNGCFNRGDVVGGWSTIGFSNQSFNMGNFISGENGVSTDYRLNSCNNSSTMRG